MGEALHTRFRYTPSGDVHFGHAVLCWLSYWAARVTGGTFTYRAETLRSLHIDGPWDSCKQWCRKNFEDLCAIGLPPSDPKAFESHGLNPTLAFEAYDDKALTDYYWVALGLRELYGDWPPEEDLRLPEQPKNCWQSRTLGCYEQGWLHPYCQLAMVVGDVTTRRNCIIRGADLQQEAIAYNMLAHAVARRHFELDHIDRLAEYVPNQYYIPKIRRSGTRLPPELRQPGGVVLSASQTNLTEGFYVRNIREAGIKPQQLQWFMGKVLFGSLGAADCVYAEWSPAGARLEAGGLDGTQLGVRAVLKKIVPKPLIDDEEWFRFLKTGEVA